MERHDAYEDEEENQQQGKNGVIIVEWSIQLDLSNLPDETEEPDEREDNSNPVDLMVNELVMLIDLEYECIVHAILAEDLDREASGEQ